MNNKPDPSRFTHNGVLQQPHYDNAVKAWEKIERMGKKQLDEAIEAAIEQADETVGVNSFVYHAVKDAFIQGAEWKEQKLRWVKATERLSPDNKLVHIRKTNKDLPCVGSYSKLKKMYWITLFDEYRHPSEIEWLEEL